jgi:hypothetical protein
MRDRNPFRFMVTPAAGTLITLFDESPENEIKFVAAPWRRPQLSSPPQYGKHPMVRAPFQPGRPVSTLRKDGAYQRGRNCREI